MYIYQSDIYCDSCGRDLCGRLRIPGDAVVGFRNQSVILDESLYDSSEYPKGPYPESQCEADTLQFCGHCGEHIDTPLTNEGIRDTLERLFDSPAIEYEDAARDALKAHGIPSHIHPRVYKRLGIDPGDTLLTWTNYPNYGGEPLVYYDENGETCCADCANDDSFSTNIVDVDVYDEGPVIYCGCGAAIESSYGDPEGK